MTSPTETPRVASPELDDLAEALRAVSGDLVRSYERLARRAERVEQELARKVVELDAARSELEAVLAALPTGVAVRDREGRVVRTNPALQRILGRSEAELLGEAQLGDLPAEDEPDAPREIRTPTGERRVVARRRSTLVDADGRPTGSVEIVDDRTDLTRLSERLHRVDKMAALGTMAAGIAHEIRNPLNAVGGFAELLQRPDVPEAKRRRWLEAIAAGVREVDAILESMLTFARPERLHLEEFDVVEMLSEAVASARRGLERPDRWVIEQHSELERLRADRIKLRQAVRNLVSNALHVQPDGGRVLLTVRRDAKDALLRCADSGPGVPPELTERIADPFFTTRAEGTGLGLSLVQAIAALHGGGLEIERTSPELGGAAFTLRIPLDPKRS